MESPKKFTVKELVYTAIMSVAIAVCSWISIPSEVPFTLQTFAVFCSLCILGGHSGFFAVMVYILLGAIGIPIFSGFTGGIGILLGPTGGYILGFLLIAAIYRIGEKISKGSYIVSTVSMTVGLIFCYAFGTLWFVYSYANTAKEIDWSSALKMCVLPFIIPDLAKMVFAVIFSNKIKKHINIRN